MFRIRLPSGEEREFRTHEEFTTAVRAGGVPDDAEIFHQRTGRWLSVTLHPDFRAARGPVRPVARRPGASRAVEAAPPEGDPIPVVTMVSLSARRRKANPLGTIAVTLAVLGGVVLFILLVRRTPEPLAQLDSPPAGTLPASSGQKAGSQTRPEANEPGPAPAPESASPAPRRDTAPVAEAAAAPKPPPPPPPTPDSLARARAREQASSSRRFEQRWRELGLSKLFSASRLHSPDSVRLTRRGLATLRRDILEYRIRVEQADQRYNDSVRTLARTGNWNSEQTGQWQQLPSGREPTHLAVRADSLLDEVERLYGVLLEQEGQYDNDAEQISFNDADAGNRYEASRARIEEILATRPDTTSLPLTRLRWATAGNSLPALVVRTPAVPPAPALPTPR